MSELRVNQRVKFKHKFFLSNGYIKRVLGSNGAKFYIVKLDQKAPDEYAWNTDEILAFPCDLEVE